jgi:hypothetical protein
MKNVICNYCGRETKWVENKEIYGKNYGNSYMVWWCKPCDAFVGCHNNTRTPKGSLANRELREWRKKAHAHIDPIWQSGILARGQVYFRLKKALGGDKEIHVGNSDIDLCKKILSVDLLKE